jgi:hypothetical protein
MKKQNYIIGSISSGTMRDEDLFPVFVDTLRELAKIAHNKAHLEFCDEVQENIDAHYEWEDNVDVGHEYFNTDASGYDMEKLFDYLQEYTLPYFYFGSHPGDGADYGFWLCENMEDEFDGLKVDDLSQVPKDYAGEILHITDHGNVSLYVKAKTQEARVVWEVV